MKIIDPKTGKAPEFHADGIAFDKGGGWLYYHPLTAETLYRINTEYLLDEALSSAQLGAKVEKLATTPKAGRHARGPDGSVYLTAFEKNAIVRYDPSTHRLPQSLKMTDCSGRTLWRGDLVADSTSPPRKSTVCRNTTVVRANKKARLRFTTRGAFIGLGADILVKPAKDHPRCCPRGKASKFCDEELAH